MEEITRPSNFIHDIIDNELRDGVNTRVQTRFPPEPNGYLHIGHAKAICIDFSTAEKYGGICNLRLDDSNPSKEDTEYIDAIKEDIEWLGYKWDKVLYASSYFDFIYECAVKLIEMGKAYVCDLTADEIREYRGTLTEGDLLWALKNMCYMDMRQAEARRIMEIERRRDNIPVHVTTSMHELVERATSQNFVPVVDDLGSFIGIITRGAIIKYCMRSLFPDD